MTGRLRQNNRVFKLTWHFLGIWKNQKSANIRRTEAKFLASGIPKNTKEATVVDTLRRYRSPLFPWALPCKKTIMFNIFKCLRRQGDVARMKKNDCMNLPIITWQSPSKRINLLAVKFWVFDYLAPFRHLEKSKIC